MPRHATSHAASYPFDRGEEILERARVTTGPDRAERKTINVSDAECEDPPLTATAVVRREPLSRAELMSTGLDARSER